MTSGNEPVWTMEASLQDLLNDGAEAVVVEILNLYLTDSAVLLEQIYAAHERAAWPLMPDLLHRMKGSALQVGAVRLGSRVREAEAAARAGDYTSSAYVEPMAALRACWVESAGAIRAWLDTRSR